MSTNLRSRHRKASSTARFPPTTAPELRSNDSKSKQCGLLVRVLRNGRILIKTIAAIIALCIYYFLSLPKDLTNEVPSYTTNKELLEFIYKNVEPGYFPDLNDRVTIARTGGSPVYGEIPWDTMTKVMEIFNATSDDIFMDLGSGTGKLVMQFVLDYGGEGHALELAARRHRSAMKARDFLRDERPEAASKMFVTRADIFSDRYPGANIILLDGVLHPLDKLQEVATNILRDCGELKNLRVWSIGKWLDFPKNRIKEWKKIRTPATWDNYDPESQSLVENNDQPLVRGQESYIWWLLPSSEFSEDPKQQQQAENERHTKIRKAPPTSTREPGIFTDRKSVEVAFKYFDGNGDGLLNIDEFMALLNAGGKFDNTETQISEFDFGDRVRLIKLGDHELAGFKGSLVEHFEEENRWRVLVDLPINRTVRVQERNLELLQKPPKYIQVSGRNGHNSKMNGVYKLSPKLHAGRVYYFKPDDFLQKGKIYTIRWYPKNGEWLFDRNGLNFDGGCNAYVQSDVPFPSLVKKTWDVYDTEKFVPDPLVKIYVVSKEEIELMALEDSLQYPWAF